MEKSKVIISGATGWLGREILQIFSETNFVNLHLMLITSKDQQVKVKNNIIMAKSFQNFNNSESITNYFDFAFLTKNKLEKIGPEKFKEINLEIIYNSTNLIKRLHPSTVVLSSSGAIYNVKKSSTGEILYSDLKKRQEEMITKACEASGSNLVISRIFNLSGRNISIDSKFAIADLTFKGIRGLDLAIDSNYLVTRRYSDITQLLKLLIKMANRGENSIFDSGGTKIELRVLANEIVRVIKSKSKVIAPEVNGYIQPDNYFSNSFSYEKLLIEILGEESLTIKKQIQNTQNSLLDIS